MTIRDLGDIQRVERHVNAKDYIAFFYRDLYLSLEKLRYFNLDKLIFLHGNAPKHKAKIV